MSATLTFGDDPYIDALRPRWPPSGNSGRARMVQNLQPCVGDRRTRLEILERPQILTTRTPSKLLLRPPTPSITQSPPNFLREIMESPRTPEAPARPGPIRKEATRDFAQTPREKWRRGVNGRRVGEEWRRGV
jgi:hypothetical protein